jgi:hypothetical protein
MKKAVTALTAATIAAATVAAPGTADAGRGWRGPVVAVGAVARPYPFTYYGYYPPAPMYYDYYLPAKVFHGHLGPGPYYAPGPYRCWGWPYRIC